MISARYFNIKLLCIVATFAIFTLHASTTPPVSKPKLTSIEEYVLNGKKIRNKVIATQSLIIIGGILYINRINPTLKTEAYDAYTTIKTSCADTLAKLTNILSNQKPQEQNPTVVNEEQSVQASTSDQQSTETKN